MTIDIPEGYESLGLALGEAAAQASRGKGADRHAEKGEPFSDQLIMSIPKRLGPGGECFCLGQALKKICESRRLPPDRARAELLGAVNYLAAAWCLLGGGESVFAPEPFKEDLVRRIREVNPAVYPQEDADMPRFRKGEPVEYRLPDGTWAPANFMHMDGGYAVLECGGPRFSVLLFEVRKADAAGPPPEDADEPLFAEGERVKYAVDGKWEPGAYVGVDPEGKHVVSTGSCYVHLDGSLVRKA